MTAAPLTEPTFTWGDRVRRARLHAGFHRQQDLADKIGVSKQLVGLWERDGATPSDLRRRFYVFALAEACGVSPAWFDGGSETGSVSLRYPDPLPDDLSAFEAEGWLHRWKAVVTQSSSSVFSATRRTGSVARPVCPA